MAALLRTLYCLSVKFGCLISATHLPGVDNTWADCLSRGWLDKFYAICPCAASFPTAIGNFVLDFSDEMDLQTRSLHCGLALLISRKLDEEGVYGRNLTVPGTHGPTGVCALAKGSDPAGAEFGQVCGPLGGRMVTAHINNPLIPGGGSSGATGQGPVPCLTSSEQLWTLLTAIECNMGKAQQCKRPIMTVLLCQFLTFLPVAPAEVQVAWGQW